MEKTYYEILQVSPEASREVIAMAYKALVKKYHPDNVQNNAEDATEMLKQVNEAFDVLSDDEKRKEYDAILKSSGIMEHETGGESEQNRKADTQDPDVSYVQRQYEEPWRRRSLIGAILESIGSLFEGIVDFIKSILSILVLIVIIGLITGKLSDWAARAEYCGLSVWYSLQKDSPREVYSEGSPENVIDQYIQSLFAGDLYDAGKCIEKDGSLETATEEISDLFKDSDDVTTCLTKDMKKAGYTIKEDGDTYLVTFTTKDYGQIYTQLGEMESKRNAEYVESGEYPTQKEADKLEKQSIRFIKTKVYKAKKNLKYDVTFRLKESEQGYVITGIDDMDSMLNALTGNLFKVIKEENE